MCKTKSFFDVTIELANNAMLKASPHLIEEWDFKKNDELGLDIYKTKKSSNKKAWWICKECKSNFDMAISNRTAKNQKCPYCAGNRVNNTNSLASLRPEIASEWHPSLNGLLTPHNVTCGSDKKIWWICFECKSEYEMKIEPRVSKSRGCSFCSGRDVNHTNSLANLNPLLASEWHPIKNGELTPNVITIGNGKKVWWLGECGHEWEAVVANRAGKERAGCPYCSHRNLLIGFNDMWTTNPEQAALLENPLDGYKYMQSSGKKVNWKCSECKNIIKNISINNINKKGLSCPICSDGISFPEKFMYNLLKECNIDFKFDSSRKWSGKLRYDFYLTDYNWIIEVHGQQHYTKSFEKTGGRSLEEEQANDRLKKWLALENDISNYIVIDARESTVEHIKKSIMCSDIMELILEEINFEEIGRISSKSLIKAACDLWMSGIHSTQKIAELMNFSRSTVLRYLKIGANVKLCNYSADRSKPIVQLDKNLDLVSKWKSATEASKTLGINCSGIRNCLRKTTVTAYGFIWMHEEEHDRLMSSSTKHVI